MYSASHTCILHHNYTSIEETFSWISSFELRQSRRSIACIDMWEVFHAPVLPRCCTEVELRM